MLKQHKTYAANPFRLTSWVLKLNGRDAAWDVHACTRVGDKQSCTSSQNHTIMYTEWRQLKINAHGPREAGSRPSTSDCEVANSFRKTGDSTFAKRFERFLACLFKKIYINGFFMSVKNENIFSNTAPARKTRHVLRQPSSRTLCNQYHYHAAPAA